MPIEIRELHIKARVADTQSSGKEGGGDGKGSGESQAPPPLDEIVAVCVERVLEILKDEAER